MYKRQAHAVKTIVAENFNERLERTDVDTFVLLHKPGSTPSWVEAELEAAAKKFAGVESVQFAKFNIAKNEIPMSHKWAERHAIEKKKLPYGWFFPASEAKKAEPSSYWGLMDEKAIAQFVAENAQSVDVNVNKAKEEL